MKTFVKVLAYAWIGMCVIVFVVGFYVVIIPTVGQSNLLYGG